MHKPADQDQKALEKFTIYVSTSPNKETKALSMIMFHADTFSRFRITPL